MRLTEQESSLLIEAWSALKNHIPSKDKNKAAEDLVQTMLHASYDMENIYDEFYGLDTYIDRALNYIAEYEESEDDEEEWLDEEWDE